MPTPYSPPEQPVADLEGRSGALSTSDIQSRVARMIEDALAFQREELSAKRERATRYYRKELPEPPKPGRSKVVLSELRDTVTQLMAPIMAILFGPQRVVEFLPRSPDHVEEADQQTELVNYIIRDANPGFLVLYGAVKDALMRYVGVVKYWWDESERVEVVSLSGVSPEDVAVIVEDGDTVLDTLEYLPDGTVRAEIRRITKEGRVRIKGVPADRFFWNRGATGLGEREFLCVGHWEDLTIAELVALGYDREEAEQVATSYPSVEPEEQVRRPLRQHDEAAQDENRLVRYYEVYAYLPDDMGRSVLHKVCVVGENAKKVMAVEPVEEAPFAVFVIDPESHDLVGGCLSDGLCDLQDITSGVARGILDSLTLALSPRTTFVEGAVNLADLMNTEINALVRTTDVNAVRQFEHRFVGDAGIGVMEFFRSIREDRHGVSRAAAGLNPDALQSSTRAAVAATVSASQQRILFLVQMLLETGLKRLCSGVYRLLQRHQDQEMTVRLRGRFVRVNPSAWSPAPEVAVSAGVLSGTHEERLTSLLAIISKQEQYLAQHGPAGPLVTLRHLRNSLAELAALTGRPDASRYFAEVSDEDMARIVEEAAQQPPSPELVLASAQVETERAKLQASAAEQAARHAVEKARVALEHQRMLLQDDRERDRLDADIALRAKELELKYQAAVDAEAIKAHLEARRVQDEAAQMAGAVVEGVLAGPVEPVPVEMAPDPSVSPPPMVEGESELTL